MMEIWRGKYLFAVTSLATQADIQTALVSLEQKSDETSSPEKQSKLAIITQTMENIAHEINYRQDDIGCLL